MLKSLILMFVIGTAANAFGGAAGYLAYGDLRGHLEPCGCDPATDLGGIERLGVAVARERSLNPDLALFSLGNNLGMDAASATKNPYLIEADEALRVTAALANVTDIILMKTGKAKFKASFPLVLSNVSGKSALKTLVKPRQLGATYHVFGYSFDDSVKNDVRRVDAPLIAEWRKELKTLTPGRTNLLLFSGPQSDLEVLAQAKLFDVIISSNSQPLANETSTFEKDDEARLRRLESPLVMMVPHGGQGILRGGALLYSVARPVSDFFKHDQEKSKETVLPFPKATFVTWLDPTLASADGPLKGIYKRYDAATRQAFLGESAKRLKNLKDSPFAGNEACTSCHAAAAEVYAKSKHAQAMATLVRKGKQEDPECVACHAVGAQAQGGFVSLQASPKFANVQCENCHGPRLAHTKDPLATKLPPVSLDLCVSCHNSQHSPRFQAAAYWQAIAHH